MDRKQTIMEVKQQWPGSVKGWEARGKPQVCHPQTISLFDWQVHDVDSADKPGKLVFFGRILTLLYECYKYT